MNLDGACMLAIIAPSLLLSYSPCVYNFAFYCVAVLFREEASYSCTVFCITQYGTVGTMYARPHALTRAGLERRAVRQRAESYT